MPVTRVDLRADSLLPWAFWGALSASALLITPGLLFYYDVTPKIACILLACAAAVGFGGWIGGLPTILGGRTGLIFVAALAIHAASATVSTLSSSDPALSLTGSEWRRLGLVVELALALWTLMLACWAAASAIRIRLTLRAVSLAGLAGGVYGVSQYFGFDPLQSEELYHIGEGYWAIVRPPGALGHAGYFATFLLPGVFAGAALAATEPRRAWRTFGIAAGGTAAVAVVLSGTRSAMLGLGAGVLLLLVCFRPKIRLRAALLLAALAIAAGAFYFTSPGERLRARTRWYVEDATGGGRLWLWRDSWRLGLDHWVSGTGLETFSAAFLPYQSLELTHVLPDRYYESPHNIFLDAWASQGLPGLVALTGLTAAAGAAGWRARRSHPRLAAYLAAGLLAVLCSSQLLSFIAATKLYFLTLIALLVALDAPQNAPPLGGRARRAAQGATLAAAAGCVWFAIQLVRADLLLERARQEISRGRPAAAVPLYRRFLEVRPPGTYADLWFSREMLHAAASSPVPEARRLWQEGKAAARRAAARSEAPQSAWYNLAIFHAEEGDVKGVEQSLRAALRAGPAWYKPYWMLAQALEAAGRREEAILHIRRAFELTAGRNESVRATWERLGSP